MKFSNFTFKNLNASKKFKFNSLQTTIKRVVIPLSLIIYLYLVPFISFAQLSSAMLDVSATNKGFLIPRVSLSSISDVLTISSPAISLLVYNTNTTGTYPNNVSPNFYFWNGNRWKTLGSPLAYSEFFALMPGDNTATIAAGTAISFPQNGLTDGVIIRSSTSQFILPAVGIYMVDWQVSISEAAQLLILLNGIEMPNTVVGRATGSSQLIGHTMINTTLPNSALSIVNPSGNSTALTVTSIAGGTHAVSANLIITRIQ